jgi:hypothetical protein
MALTTQREVSKPLARVIGLSCFLQQEPTGKTASIQAINEEQSGSIQFGKDIHCQ